MKHVTLFFPIRITLNFLLFLSRKIFLIIIFKGNVVFVFAFLNFKNLKRKLIYVT